MHLRRQKAGNAPNPVKNCSLIPNFAAQCHERYQVSSSNANLVSLSKEDCLECNSLVVRNTQGEFRSLLLYIGLGTMSWVLLRPFLVRQFSCGNYLWVWGVREVVH